MNGMRHDVSLALRQIRRRPGFSLLVVLTLGSAIGVNTGLFAIFNTVVFHSFPIAAPDRVVHVQNRTPDRPVGTSIAEWRYLSREAKSFESLAAMPWGRTVRLDGREVRLQYVSANFFTTLGTPMEQGRGFLSGEDGSDSAGNVAVVSRALWNSAFGADPEILGRKILLDDVPFTVVGVTGFSGFSLRPTQVWVPLTAQTYWEAEGSRDYLTSAQRCCAEIVGRLAAGVPPVRAAAEVEMLSARFRGPLGLKAETFQTTPAGSTASRARRLLIRAGFGLFFVSVTLVLLLACANVGNLLLARAYERRPEMAVRLTLGAGRARLVRQLLVEALALAMAAGLVGIALARVLPVLILSGVPEAAGWDFPTDHRVLLYTLALSILACVAAGLAPAVHATRAAAGLTRLGVQGAPAPRLRLRSALMAGQVAISVVLLVGAGLLVRGLRHALTQDLGFTLDGVTVVSYETSFRPTDAASVRAFVDQLEQAVESLAGADRVVLTPTLPMEGARGRFRLPGEEAQRWASSQTVSPRYFELLRVPLLAGREFAPGDAADRVVVVNESLARTVWPGETAVGRSLVWRGTTREVLGVARDAQLTDFGDVGPTVFSLSETPLLPHVLVRDAGGGLPRAIADAATRIDPRVQATVAPLSASFDRVLRAPRLAASVAGGVGALALALSTLGLFGFCAYSVEQRTREIGIRVALGARPTHVLASVFRPTSAALLTGLAAGVVGAVAGSYLLRHLLFGLSALDPITYSGVGVLLLAAALIATYVPTRRALRIDPAAALRHE